jgi:hypothetical protein
VSKVQEAGVVDAAKDAYYKVSSVAVTAATSVKERLETAAQGPQKPLANFPKGKIAATGFGSDSFSSQQPSGSDVVSSNGDSAHTDGPFSAPPFARPGHISLSRPTAGSSGPVASAPVRVLFFEFGAYFFLARFLMFLFRRPRKALCLQATAVLVLTNGQVGGKTRTAGDGRHQELGNTNNKHA